MTRYPQKPEAETKRDPVRTIVFYGLVLLVGIIVCEAVFRTVIFPQWRALQTASFIHHPIYGTFQKPNMEIRRYSPPNYDVINRTNALGFRDRQDGFVSEDLNGIWIAGSSNTFGAGVEDSELYTAVIEGMGYRAANLSSEGHKLWNQVLVVRHLASQGYKPRAVIIEMTMNNTLVDEGHMGVFEEPLPTGTAEQAPKKRAAEVLLKNIWDMNDKFQFNLHGIKTKLINNSAIYGWLKVGINNIPFLHDLMLSWGLLADVADAPGGPLELMQEMPDNPSDGLISGTTDFIKKLQRWVRDNLDAPLGVIVIPNQYQLHPERLTRLTSHLGLDPGRFDTGRPAGMLSQQLQAAGVPVLNLTAPILAHQLDHYTYPDNAHITAEVHHIVAENLAVWLQGTLGVSPRR